MDFSAPQSFIVVPEGVLVMKMLLWNLTSQPSLAICLYDLKYQRIYVCLTYLINFLPIYLVMRRQSPTFHPISNDYLFSRILLPSGKEVQWLCFHKTTTLWYVWYSLKPLLYGFTFVNNRLFLIIVNPKSLLIKLPDAPYGIIFLPWNLLLRLMSFAKPLNTHDLTHNKRNYWYRLPRILYHLLNSNCKPEYTFVHDKICLPHYIL